MSRATVVPPAPEELEKVRVKISDLVELRKFAPLLLRLAYHDAFTYDSGSSTGGANGSIRNQKELRHAGNEGLSTAIEALAQIKEKHPALSHAGLNSALRLPSATARPNDSRPGSHPQTSINWLALLLWKPLEGQLYHSEQARAALLNSALGVN